MSRRHGKDRGLVFKNGLWWVRLYINGREKWYRADSKTQAKTLYGRLKAYVREEIGRASCRERVSLVV